MVPFENVAAMSEKVTDNVEKETDSDSSDNGWTSLNVNQSSVNETGSKSSDMCSSSKTSTNGSWSLCEDDGNSVRDIFKYSDIDSDEFMFRDSPILPAFKVTHIVKCMNCGSVYEQDGGTKSYIHYNSPATR